VTVTTWEEANRSLVLALRLERIVLFVTVFLIVVVAGLNLAATSAVLAATRAEDAAILRSSAPRRGPWRASSSRPGRASASRAPRRARFSTAPRWSSRGPAPSAAGALTALTHVLFRVDPAELVAVVALGALVAPRRVASGRTGGAAERGGGAPLG
jgi:hypothetical protein